MSRPAVLAIDQGTTNTKAIVVDGAGAVRAQGSAPVAIEHPEPGWVQQDPEVIWGSVVAAIEACLRSTPSLEICGIGISNQRESVVVWDRKSGAAVGPAVTWQCRRTTAVTEDLKAKGAEPEVIARTGLPLDPLFPAPKIKWLLDKAGEGDLCAGTVDSWLIWKLTGGKTHATDRSNASRTQLLNVQTGEWDDDLCALFGVPTHVLPTVRDSKDAYGETVNIPGLPDGVPVGAAIGDSHAALFGHLATGAGDAKVTFGTGSSVMATVPSFRVPEDGVTTTIAWAIDGAITYAYEGNILVSASLFPWVADLLGLEGDVDALMALAETVEGSGGCSIVPAMVGLGAPHWVPTVRGLIAGLTFGTAPAHVAYAAAEAIALQIADVFETIKAQSPVALGRLFVDGGPSRNTFLMQLVADHLRHPVLQRDAAEISALGAAYLAGLQTGLWADMAVLDGLALASTEIAPRGRSAARVEAADAWRDAVRRCVLPTAG